jgi:hypothetical protein
MASIIRIKRSLTAGDPAVLGAGELAYSAADYTTISGGGRLYIGIGTESGGDAASHLVIGGKYFTDKLDHSPGTLTASSALIVDADSKIDNLLVDNLQLNGNTISSTDTNGVITLDPNGTGYVQIVGTNALVIPSGTSLQQAPSIAGAIRLNTDTSQFEGYSGTNWSSLGGVRSVDGQTYISAELTAGAADDTVRIFTNGTLAFQIDDDSAQFETKIASVKIAATTAATGSNTGALQVAGGVSIEGALYIQGSLTTSGAGSFTSINDTPIGNITPSTGAFSQLDVDNIRIDGNTISSTNTNGDIVVTPNGTGKTIISNVYIGSDTVSIDEYIQDITGGQVVAGEGIDVTYDDTAGTTTISAEDASTSNKGVASFADADFNVTTGAVELKDTVVKGFTVDADAAVTPSGHSVQITGGEGIDVTVSGAVITVAGEDASSSNKGVASFNTASFDVTSGDVTIKTGGVTNTQLENSDVTIGTTSIALGDSSTTLEGLTEVTVGDITVSGNTITSPGNIVLQAVFFDEVTEETTQYVVDVAGSRITEVGDPLGGYDAANKRYVDNIAAGLTIKPAVKVATTADLGAVYDNGASGVGSTLTIPATATLTIDGVSLTEFDGILVKDQTNAEENGRYYISTLGDSTTAWVLTRCSKCDEPFEIPSMYVFVQEGTLYNSTGWVAAVDNLTNFAVGTSDIIFTQFSGAGTYLAGEGLSLDGNEFSVNVGDGIVLEAGDVTLASTVAGDGLTYTNGVLDIGGTADRITVNADSIDIASTYVGQSSITTLGTITTGTWNGTTIGVAYGGTGLASYTYGDLLVGDVAGGLSALTVGSTGKVLQSNGSTVVYGDVDGGTY